MPTPRRCAPVAAALLIAASQTSLGSSGLDLDQPASPAATPDASIAREGQDARREALDAMERKPFDVSLLGKLSSWNEPGPVTPAQTSGKVVLVFTWAGWYPPSMRVFSMVESLHKKFGDDLVVIGAHAPRRGERASEVAARRGATFHIAHDKDGALRTALKVDQDPDFYVIDRAGQLRFADIQTGSVARAVEVLIAESRDEAASLNDRLAAQAARSEAAFRRTNSINNEVDLRKLPEVPFIAPQSQDYKFDRAGHELDWPKFPVDPNQRYQEDKDPTFPLTVPPTLEFKTPVPKTAGRAIIAYFWHPSYPRTYERIMPAMDRLALQRGRDVVVMGVMTPLEQRSRSGGDNTELNDPDRLRIVLEGMMRAHEYEHTIAFDATGALFESVRNAIGQQNSGQGVPLLAVVVSSDGIARWVGSPTRDSFRLAVDKVLAVDPGVAARRAAEAEYIRANFAK